MTAMNHAEAEELLGAYALGALPHDEAERMEEHLRSCTEHRSTAAELQRTASLLALTPEEREPSPQLRTRIMQAISATGSQEPAQPGPAATPVPVVVPIRRAPRMPRWAPRPAVLALAAALVIAVGVGSLIGYQIGQIGQPVAYTFRGDTVAAPGAQARLVYFKDREQAVLAASGLPHLSPGLVYELWLIKGGVPQDKGVGTSVTGDLAAQISGDLSQYQEFAITIEPGEQPLPTTKPILIGQLKTG